MKKLLSILLITAMTLSVSATTVPSSMEKEKVLCGYCGECEGCGFSTEYMLGDVDGNGSINYMDSLEILKYIAGMDGALNPTNPDYERRARAADINGDGTIDIWDAVEIWAYLNKSPSFVTGTQNSIVYASPESVRVEVDMLNSKINYITNEDFTGVERIKLEQLKVDGGENTNIRNPSANYDDFSLDLTSLPGARTQNGNYVGALIIPEPIPAGSVIMTQSFEGKPQEIKITGKFNGENIDITLQTKLKISDALEILKYLANMDSVYDNLVAKPKMTDALDILKYLAGMDIR